MEQNIYKEYALLVLEIEALEDKRENMRRRILEELIIHSKDNYKTEFGVFTVVSKVIWVYSPKFDKLEKRLKERLELAKITEQKKGIAKATEKPHISYTPKKL